MLLLCPGASNCLVSMDSWVAHIHFTSISNCCSSQFAIKLLFQLHGRAPLDLPGPSPRTPTTPNLPPHWGLCTPPPPHPNPPTPPHQQDAASFNTFWNIRTNNDSLVLPPYTWAPRATWVDTEGAKAVSGASRAEHQHCFPQHAQRLLAASNALANCLPCGVVLGLPATADATFNPRALWLRVKGSGRLAGFRASTTGCKPAAPKTPHTHPPSA